MRTRAAVTSIFASVGVLAIGWQIGAATVAAQTASTTTPATTGSAASSSTITGTPSATAAPSATATPSATAAAPVAAAPATPSTDGTWTGSAVTTVYGPVQVQVVISGGQITDIIPLQLTGPDGRSVSISNQAAPMLKREVLAAQSAKVSNIGGATYTTRGYLGSVQSALDQAGF